MQNNPPQTLAVFCAALTTKAVDLDLALPGKQMASSAAGASGTGGRVKTGWVAPNADLLRMALRLLPNDLNNPKHDRDYWLTVGHASKGAAVAAGLEAEGREAWLEWSAKHTDDPDAAARFWDTCTRPSTGYGKLRAILEVENPQGHADLNYAEAVPAFAQQAATNHATIAAAVVQPVAPFNPNPIPPREFLYCHPVVRRMISILAAPGGAGKSALVLVRAVAMVTGRELLAGEKPFRKPLTVWMHNAEDDRDELNRRLAAVLLHYGLDYADLGGRLIMTSGRDLNLVLASMGKDGAAMVPGVIDGLLEQVKGLGVDVLILDPLGAMHTLPENSNEAVNVLAKGLRELAERAKVAIVLVHHTSKAAAQDMNAAGAGAARGASALVDAARVVEQVVPMSDKEAARFGIAEDDRRGYMRVENGKANMAPAVHARWLRMRSVALNNGTADYPAGDRVGVVERWTPPGPVSGTPSDLYLVQQALGQANLFDTRPDPRSLQRWVGWLIARTLNINAGHPGQAARNRTAEEAAGFSRVKSMLDGWLADGGLILDDGQGHDHKPAKFVGVGTPAIIRDADADADAASDAAAGAAMTLAAPNLLFPAGAIAHPHVPHFEPAETCGTEAKGGPWRTVRPP